MIKDFTRIYPRLFLKHLYASVAITAVRFSHENIEIHAGQTVEWDAQGPLHPHTITFGQEPVDLMNPSPDVTVDPDGARHAIIASPSDSTHSGFIIAMDGVTEALCGRPTRGERSAVAGMPSRRSPA